MQYIVGIARGEGGEKRIARRGGRSPALFEAERGSQDATHDIEGAALIAEYITPAAGASRPVFRIPAKCHRTGAGDRDDSRLAGCRTGERDHRVMGDRVLFRGNDFTRERLLILGSAAEAHAGRFKFDWLSRTHAMTGEARGRFTPGFGEAGGG